MLLVLEWKGTVTRNHFFILLTIISSVFISKIVSEREYQQKYVDWNCCWMKEFSHALHETNTKLVGKM